MHKLITSQQRDSGSNTIGGNIIIASLPDVKKAIRTANKSFPYEFEAFELDSLSQEEINLVEWSEELMNKIKDKGFTFTRINMPIVGPIDVPFGQPIETKEGDILSGYEFSLPGSTLNTSDGQSLQKLASMYLEIIFGYWEVYEMDFEKLETQGNIFANGLLDLKGYPDFEIVRIRIEETAGLGDGATLNILDDDDNLLTSTVITPNMDIELEVVISFTTETSLKVQCDDWAGAYIDMMTKHTKKKQ